MTGNSVSAATNSDGRPDSSDFAPNCPVIDAHVHVLPTKLMRAISNWFDENTDWTVPERSPETVVDRVTAMTDGFVFFPYAHRPGISSSLNEFAAEWQSRTDSAIGLGTVHAGDDDPAQIVDDLLENGLNGVKIHCPVQGFAADDSRLDSVYERLVGRDAPLVIHASTHPFYRGETELGVEPIRAVLERYPNLRVCIPHLGLFETRSFLGLVEEYHVYMDTAVALGPRTHELIGLSEGELPVDELRSHSDRVMFGTDYPIRPISYGSAFRGIGNTFPDQSRDVFYENAKRFFGFD